MITASNERKGLFMGSKEKSKDSSRVTMLVREPETGDYREALTVQPDGSMRGTYLVGSRAAMSSVFVPGEKPDYVESHPALINASSAEQYEKHGFGD